MGGGRQILIPKFDYPGTLQKIPPIAVIHGLKSVFKKFELLI
jgi:hypothetical protein